MESWQRKRIRERKDPGTQGSLCDGMAWLHNHVEGLEEEAAGLRAKLAEAEEEIAGMDEMLNDPVWMRAHAKQIIKEERREKLRKAIDAARKP